MVPVIIKKVTDKDKCPCYTARVIKNVKVDISPQWIQSRLEAAGIRPINNIVDITLRVLIIKTAIVNIKVTKNAFIIISPIIEFYLLSFLQE